MRESFRSIRFALLAQEVQVGRVEHDSRPRRQAPEVRQVSPRRHEPEDQDEVECVSALPEILLDRGDKRRIEALDAQPLQVGRVAVEEQVVVDGREGHLASELLQDAHDGERRDGSGVLVRLGRAEIEYQHSKAHATFHRPGHLLPWLLVRGQALAPARVQLAPVLDLVGLDPTGQVGAGRHALVMDDPGQGLEQHGAPGVPDLEGQVRVFAVRGCVVCVKAPQLPEQPGRHQQRRTRHVVHFAPIRGTRAWQGRRTCRRSTPSRRAR